MIKIKSEGNTTIRVATSGTTQGTKWTVYPSYGPDPTLQKFSKEQREREKELSIRGIQKPGEDISGRGMAREIAEAIARLNRNLGYERYTDLGMKADKIAVSPESPILKILAEEYDINPVEAEVQAPPEAKG